MRRPAQVGRAASLGGLVPAGPAPGDILAFLHLFTKDVTRVYHMQAFQVHTNLQHTLIDTCVFLTQSNMFKTHTTYLYTDIHTTKMCTLHAHTCAHTHRYTLRHVHTLFWEAESSSQAEVSRVDVKQAGDWQV